MSESANPNDLLIQVYAVGHRDGWEDGDSVDVVMERIKDYLDGNEPNWKSRLPINFQGPAKLEAIGNRACSKLKGDYEMRLVLSEGSGYWELWNGNVELTTYEPDELLDETFERLLQIGSGQTAPMENREGIGDGRQ